MAGARPYVAGAGVHRVVGADQSSGGAWRIANGRVPNERLAQGVSDAGVVLCFGEETRATLGTCDFYSTLHGSVVGPPPIQCSQNIGRPSSSTYQGSSVGSSQIGPWLTSTLASGGAVMAPMN